MRLPKQWPWRRGLRSGIVLSCVVLATSLASSGDPSPQDVSIAAEAAVWERERQQTEALKQAVLIQPDDEQSWEALLSRLQDAESTRRNLAHLARRRDWAPQPDLQGDLKAESEGELLQWVMAAVAANPSNSEFQLHLLDLQTGSNASLAEIEELLETSPDDPRLAYCLAQGKAEEMGIEAGSEFLSLFVANHGDNPDAFQAQINYLEEHELEKQMLDASEERARRFPEEPRFRVDLMAAIARSSRTEEIQGPALSRLEAKASGLLERAALCKLVEAGEQETLARGCFQRLWRSMLDLGFDQLGDKGSLIQSSVLEFAEWVDDEDWVVELLKYPRGIDAIADWAEAFDYESKPRLCEPLLFAFMSGSLGTPQRPEEPEMQEWLSAWSALARSLEDCGTIDEANRIRELVISELPTSFLEDLNELEALATAELLRRYKTQGGDLELLRILAEDPDHFPDVPRESVLRAWAEGSPSSSPALKLAAFLRSLGRFEEEEKAIDLALKKNSKDLDLYLWRGGAAFNAGRLDRAFELTSAFLRDRQASPRQQATARYLLGRIARREGRMEEATQHFEHYFLRRFAYAGCCHGGADAGFLAHLRETAGADAVAGYFEAKDKALLEFYSAAVGGPFEENCDKLSCDTFRDPSPAKTAFAEQVDRSNPTLGFMKTYLTDVLTKRARWKTEDPEDLFNDEEVLGFDPTDLGPPKRYGFRNTCMMWVSADDSFGARYSPDSQHCPW